MGKGNSKDQKIDWINSFDPRTQGAAAQKGTLFRYVPATGAPELLLKRDDGFSTNWGEAGGSPVGIYVVGVNEEFTTIQSAIDQALADGMSGTNRKTIVIMPGIYVEDLTLYPGLLMQSFGSTLAYDVTSVRGHATYDVPANPNLIENQINFYGLTFFDEVAGNTFTVNSNPGNALVIFDACFFIKRSSGQCVRSIGFNIVSLYFCNLQSQSPDPAIYGVGQWQIFYTISTSNGGTLFSIDGGSSINITDCALINEFGTPDAQIILAGGSRMYFMNSTILSFSANSSGIIVDATSVANVTNCLIDIPAGTGYVLGGSGTVNGTLIAYNQNSAKEPGLTFNLLPSDS